MDFLTLVNQRQSDRSYLPKAIESEKLNKILECGCLAPSACNAQPWKFIVVDSSPIRGKVAEAAKGLGMNKWAGQAPVIIVVVEEHPNLSSLAGGLVKNKHFPFIDIGIAVGNICLAATEEGLGSCIMGWFNEKKIKKTLGIPAGKRVPLLISIGYPAGTKRKKIRKDTSNTISYNTYK
ncbi:MAG: nitroreductase family protein [Bacteroidales bacterium]|nr:nitroreductase family protein [Bacteroidales bacterium]